MTAAAQDEKNKNASSRHQPSRSRSASTTLAAFATRALAWAVWGALGATALVPGMTLAAPTDCIGQSADGKAVCSTAMGGPWGVQLCDGLAAYQYIDAMWCEAAGGTWQGYYVPNEGPCKGGVPTTEGNMAAIATAFMKRWKGPTASLISDSGWNGSPVPSLCGAGGRVWKEGVLAEDNRTFNFTYTDDDGNVFEKPIWARRGRHTYCPSATSPRYNNGVFLGCAHPVAADQCGPGNPILPGVAAKVQVETDGWFEGRAIKRYYSSKGSIHQMANSIPLEITDQDTAWRGEFDIRLEPLTNPYVMAALSLPNGTIQYFRPDGRPVLGTDKNLLRLTAVTGGYRLYTESQLLDFDATGKLTRLSETSGRYFTLRYSDGTIAGPNGQIARGADGQNSSDTLDTAVPAGHLIEVQSSNGRSLKYQRDISGHVTQLHLPENTQPIKFNYGSVKLLDSVAYPDGYVRIYHYDEREHIPYTQRPLSLTGISETGPTGQPVRLATFKYDNEGVPITTTYAHDANKHNLNYSAAQTTVTDPLGSQRTLTFANVLGVTKLVAASQPAGSGCNASTSSMGYDVNGNLAVKDDFNGNRVCFTHDATRNLETTRVEGLATTAACSTVLATNATLPAGSRKITTDYHPDWPLEARVAEPGRVITKVYNGRPDPYNGNAIASCAPSTALLPDGKPIPVLCRLALKATTDANGALGFNAAQQSGVNTRQTTWTYDAMGRVLTEDGPRTDVVDVTTYAYHTDTTADHTVGDLKTVTNAAGKVTQFTKYTKSGQLLGSTDPNGVLTVNTYDARQRLKSSSVGGRQTTYDYHPNGQLKKMTLPDGSWISYEYDQARRLVAVHDNNANRIDYVLDAAGNRIGENTKDPGGTLKRQLLRSVDALNRVQQVTGRE